MRFFASIIAMSIVRSSLDPAAPYVIFKASNLLKHTQNPPPVLRKSPVDSSADDKSVHFGSETDSAADVSFICRLPNEILRDSLNLYW
jgi:hypothetical protein